MPEIVAVGSGRFHLGEGPVWCPVEHVLYWVDIFARNVHRLRPDPEEVAMWTLPETIGSLVVRETGGLILALKHRIVAFDPDTEGVETLATVEPDKPENRFNDGRCDRQGRFLAGTMHEQGQAPSGILWRFDRDLSAHAIFDNAWVPNSLCWSPDGRIMYWADSQANVIWAHDYDTANGTPSGRRVFADLTHDPGVPDGSTVDAEGYLWNAQYGGGRVVRYAPDGSIDCVIELPALQPTCCAFGGPDLNRLYVTTARQGMDAAALEAEPRNGALLAIETDVQGLAEPRFAG